MRLQLNLLLSIVTVVKSYSVTHEIQLKNPIDFEKKGYLNPSIYEYI